MPIGFSLGPSCRIPHKSFAFAATSSAISDVGESCDPSDRVLGLSSHVHRAGHDVHSMSDCSQMDAKQWDHSSVQQTHTVVVQV